MTSTLSQDSRVMSLLFLVTGNVHYRSVLINFHRRSLRKCKQHLINMHKLQRLGETAKQSGVQKTKTKNK